MIARKETIERAIAATYQERTQGWKGRLEVLEDLLENPSKAIFWRNVMRHRHQHHLLKDRTEEAA